MREELLKIINHYGVDNQQRKLEEEVFELQQAINTYELQKSVEYEIPLTEIIGTKEHLEEEVGDVLNVLYQFIFYYDLDSNNIIKGRVSKIVRTLGEMKK